MRNIDHESDDSLLHSLRGKVFSQLENDILFGKYNAGDSLNESKLSNELGVSRTPIREALRQLELEGLVRSIPNKGAIVNGITNKDIEDIYTIRMMIEGLASRWAAENITNEQLALLQEIVDFEEFYTIKDDVKHLLELDSKFHEIIFRASKSKPLMQTLLTFHHYIQKARISSLESPGRPSLSFEEHKAILKAIKDKDGELAERLTIDHIRNASINFTNSFREKSNP